MLTRRMLDRMTQEEKYQAFLLLSEVIENEALEQFAGETSKVVPNREYSEAALELLVDPDAIHGVATGYGVIDKLTQGFEPEELIVVGAVEGVGKSMLVQNFLHNIGKRDIPNLFISMEMSNAEAQKRYIEMEMGSTRAKKEEARKLIESKPFYYYQADNVSLEQMDEDIGKAVQEHGIKIVAIDHLHYFAPQSTEGNSSAVIGYTIRKIKMMARKHQVPIIVISHLTKLKKKGMPDKSALRDSSFIAQDADCVIMLWRDWASEDPVVRHTLEFDIQKNRTRGRLGRGKLTVIEGHKVSEI